MIECSGQKPPFSPAETRRKCQEQLSSAQAAADRYWTEARQRMEEYCTAHEELQRFLGNRDGKGPKV